MFGTRCFSCLSANFFQNEEKPSVAVCYLSICHRLSLGMNGWWTRLVMPVDDDTISQQLEIQVTKKTLKFQKKPRQMVVLAIGFHLLPLSFPEKTMIFTKLFSDNWRSSMLGDWFECLRNVSKNFVTVLFPIGKYWEKRYLSYKQGGVQSGGWSEETDEWEVPCLEKFPLDRDIWKMVCAQSWQETDTCVPTYSVSWSQVTLIFPKILEMLLMEELDLTNIPTNFMPSSNKECQGTKLLTSTSKVQFGIIHSDMTHLGWKSGNVCQMRESGNVCQMGRKWKCLCQMREWGCVKSGNVCVNEGENKIQLRRIKKKWVWPRTHQHCKGGVLGFQQKGMYQIPLSGMEED